jgi:hypothetical protein
LLRRFLLPLLLLLAAGPALAQARIGVRVGEHPGHGRVVFDWPAETGYRLEEQDGRVVLRFARPAEFDLPPAARLPRNLRGFELSEAAVTLLVPPGVRARHFRLGARVVVDLLDATEPAAAPARPAPARPEPARPSAARAAPAARPAPPAQPAPSPAAPPGPVASRAPETPAAPAVLPPAAQPAAPPAIVPVAAPAPSVALPAVRALGNGVLVPAAAEVGAALLRRGGTWLLVLDAPLRFDAAALSQGAFAGTEIARGPQATVLRIPAAALAEPRLTRRPEGWLLEGAAAPPELRSIRPELDPGPPARLLLRAVRPAQAVAVLDPESGATLLVGTVREGGEATSLARRAATFEILPTRLGVAILPRADSVTLRPLASGFAAGAGPGAALALGAEAGVEPGLEAEAATMSRLFDMPAAPLPALIERERNAMLFVAAAPPLGRGQPRLAAAQALLALGLGVEAQAMANLAAREDPRLAEDPIAQALLGAAALLAGRLEETAGLLHPRLAETDELLLWRGLLAAARRTEDGAAGIATGLPILRAWPEPLRARLAPLAAEALAAGGELAAARRLLAGQEAEPAFALARARLLEEAGEAAAALEAYDALRRGADRRARAVAMRRAAELRLARGELDAAGAAAALEPVLAAWRGDGMESAARLRLAELRTQAGDHRGAFEMLQETAQLFPELAPRLRPATAEALLAALSSEPPLGAVALFDAHAALLPRGEATERALAALADGLAALDLPQRARAVLGQALARAEEAEARGRLGLRLAVLALGASDPAGARAALADTEAATLPAALRRERALAEARALARLGDADAATARYREAGPAAAPELAEFLASRQDWAGAAAVLGTHLADTVPPIPAPLDAEARRLVARRAALLALAGDEAGLAALRQAEGPRMSGGAFEEAFALISAGRLGGMEGLPRLRQELELARALSARPDGLRAAAGTAR